MKTYLILLSLIVVFFVEVGMADIPKAYLSKTCDDGMPHCVSSEDASSKFYVEPYLLQNPENFRMEQLRQVILSMARTEILLQTETELRATFKSLIFRFVDDVWIWRVGEQLFFKSISREGYSDLGVNRRRVNKLKEQLGESHF